MERKNKEGKLFTHCGSKVCPLVHASAGRSSLAAGVDRERKLDRGSLLLFAQPGLSAYALFLKESEE